MTDGRHSYSLTTFNTDGKLEQVERALVASSLGPPIIAVITGETIILASPQLLPSPLMNDDGTSRFTLVSPHIVVGHSGITADGRVLIESAQRLAIEHAYLFDEPISIGLFLEELSLLFQAYTGTKKTGVRPFGCTLLVGFLDGGTNKTKHKPRLFQIDCSGAVVEHGTVAIINGKFLGEQLNSRLIDLAKQSEDGNHTVEKGRESVSRILEEALEVTSITKKVLKNLSNKDNSDKDRFIFRLPLRIISASYCQKEGFKVERRLASTCIEPK